MPIDFKGHEWFVSRLYDMQEACLQQERPVMTSFLTPAEQQIAEHVVSLCELKFCGGYDGAERRQAVLYPYGYEADQHSSLKSWPDADLYSGWSAEGMEQDPALDSGTEAGAAGFDPDNEDCEFDRSWETGPDPQQSWRSGNLKSGGTARNTRTDQAGRMDGDIVCLQSALNPNLPGVAHPDVLGTLLHEGIAREMIGDILCTDQGVCIFCRRGMSEYIRRSIVRIKKQNVRFEEIRPDQVPKIERRELLVNVSSLRADNIVAALANCSRSKAMQMIRQGLVKINDVVLEDQRKLCNNDHVSIRRCGRFLYLGLVKTTRKDRMVLKFQKYQ